MTLKDIIIAGKFTISEGGGGGGDLSSMNLFANATFSSGYLDSSGYVKTAGGSTKEVYSDEIDITGMTTLALLAAYERTDEFWVWCCWYNSSHGFISRTAPYNSVVGTCPSVTKITPPANAVYLKITFRTYGEIVCALMNYYDAFDFLEDSNATKITQ